MSNFLKRTLTAIVFVAVLLGCTFWNQYSFSLLFFLITTLGLLEFYKLAEKGGSLPQRIFGTLIGVFFFVSCAMVSMKLVPTVFLLLTVPLLFLIFIFELYTKSIKPFDNIAITIFGIVYVAVPFSLLNFITTYGDTYSYQILFGFFFILWSSDSGAYLAGSAFGKHKLFPRISPGKTWEGSFGGAIASYLVAFIISGWYTSISMLDWMVIATILVVIGTFGDLVESMFKRSIDVKDSGNLLPGHGGILDRFDSLIIATPFVFTYLYFIKFF